MTVYVAVDFHARQQTISYLDTADGEIHQLQLRHQHDDVRKFYEQFAGEVIVGLEARVTALGLNRCWQNWATRCGWVIQQRSDAKRRVARRTIAAMPI